MGTSRSMITAAVSVIGGLLTILGVDLDESTKTALIENINLVFGGVMVLYGIVIGILRKITSSPLVGWFKKELS